MMCLIKRLFSVLLIVTFCAGFSGCSDNEKKGLTTQEGKLIWGTNATFEPYEYMEGDEVVGIDAEIADAIAEKLGLVAQVENMEFTMVIPALVTNKIDMGLSGITVSDERKRNVDFSDTYYDAGQSIVVRKDSDIKSASDLQGKVIGVQSGTTGDEYVSDPETGVNPASVERFSSAPDAAQSLNTKKIDAVVIDDGPAQKLVEANDKLTRLQEKLTSEEYAIAIKKDNTELLNAVNEAIREMKESGQLQQIIDKYFAEQ